MTLRSAELYDGQHVASNKPLQRSRSHMAIKNILYFARTPKPPPPPRHASPVSGAREKGNKAQQILGLSRNDMAIARKQSVTSSMNSKFQSVAFSDATTEFDLPIDSDIEKDVPSESIHRTSIRLQEPVVQEHDLYTPSHELMEPISFYDRSEVPLAVSQQTSESSRRDFALRKGAPHAVGPREQERHFQRQHHQMKMANPRNSLMPNSFSKRSSLSLRSKGSLTRRVAKPTGLEPTLEPLDSLKSTKIHVKRPVKNIKHWFDAVDDESSSDELEAHPDVFDSLIAPSTIIDVGGPPESTQLPSIIVDKSFASSESRQQSPPRSRPLSLLSTEVQLFDHLTFLDNQVTKPNPRRQSRRITEMDLSRMSVLDLSSPEDTEDEREDDEISRVSEEAGTSRTSYKDPSEILPDPECTAKDEDVCIEEQRHDDDIGMEELFTAFPQTPSDLANSARSIDQGSASLSDDASVESRRLMQVTHQEQLLLAAIRLKKVAMKRNGALLQKKDVAELYDLDMLPRPERLSPHISNHSGDGIKLPYGYWATSPTTSGDESFHSTSMTQTSGGQQQRSATSRASRLSNRPSDAVSYTHGRKLSKSSSLGRGGRPSKIELDEPNNWSFTEWETRIGLGLKH